MPGAFGPQNSRVKQWLPLDISTRSWIYVDRRVNSFRTSEHARDALRQVHHFSTRHDDFALAVGQFDPFLFFHRSFHLMKCNRKAGAFASLGQKLRSGMEVLRRAPCGLSRQSAKQLHQQCDKCKDSHRQLRVSVDYQA